MTQPALTQINIYPVKSLGGLSTPSANVEARGLQYDRRWMVVDRKGRFLTQRALPRMALVSVTVGADGLMLRAPSCEPLSVPLQPLTDATETVRVWRSVCQAVPVNEEADRWFTDFLCVPCRLVYMHDETRRAVNPDHSAGEGIVSFADGYPLMLLAQASLEDLNSRLEQPVCSLITVDQAAGALTGPEPLKTLASYRLQDQKVLFGQLLIPDGADAVRVGDAVEIC